MTDSDEVLLGDAESEILFGLKESLDESEEERKEKSLLNSFPFNQAEQTHHGEGHGHDHANHGSNGDHEDHGHRGDHSAHSNHAIHGDHQTTIEDRGVLVSLNWDQDFHLKM